MDPITLKSGASLAVTPASFSAANQLLKIVARELTHVKFEFDLRSFSELADKDIDILKNAAFQLLQSDALESALMECMKKCLHNDKRITAATFEPEEARQDYLPVAWEVMKVNLRPFFSGLDLSSLINAQQASKSPRSE